MAKENETKETTKGTGGAGYPIAFEDAIRLARAANILEDFEEACKHFVGGAIAEIAQRAEDGEDGDGAGLDGGEDDGGLFDFMGGAARAFAEAVTERAIAIQKNKAIDTIAQKLQWSKPALEQLVQHLLQDETPNAQEAQND